MMVEEKEEKKTESWEDVINNFLQSKIDAGEEQYLKDKIKEINELYKKERYFGKDKIKDFFNTKKNKKKDNQTNLNFQREKYQKIFEMDDKPKGLVYEAFDGDYHKKREELKSKFEPHSWISQAAKNAASVTFATHVFKLTHSKIDSPSIFDQIDSKRPGILSSSVLQEKTIDGAVKGNQFAPVYQFLELELNGKKLAPEFIDEENSVLECFAVNREELLEWNRGFYQALVNGNPRTHPLAKQIYFPTNQAEPLNSRSYHLLANVKSSSLAHAFFEKQVDNKQRQVRKFRDNSKFSESPVNTYINRAIIKVTQSNHGNASQLNGKRGGKITLFNSQPPTWESQLKPPIAKRSFFYGIYDRQIIKENIDYLRYFLLRFERIGLSIRAPNKKKWIDFWVINIIEEVMAYATTIRSLPSGWTKAENIKLKKEHQYFLDPNRDDESFQAGRRSSDWQTVICNDFAIWLNGRLKGKKKKFTPQAEHTRMWKKIMGKEFRDFVQIADAHIHNNIKEEA